MKTLRQGFLLAITWLLTCSSPMTDIFVSSDLVQSDFIQDGKYLLYKKSPFSGILTDRYPSGEIKSQSHYFNGSLEGVVKTWYRDGSKESVRFYNKGEKEGLHQGWWQNGNPRFEYMFRAGAYHGSFKEWYEDGKLLHVFEYDHGQEVRAIGWRQNGKTYINFAVHNGKKYGLTNARLCYSLKDEQGLYQSNQ